MGDVGAGGLGASREEDEDCEGEEVKPEQDWVTGYP